MIWWSERQLKLVNEFLRMINGEFNANGSFK